MKAHKVCVHALILCTLLYYRSLQALVQTQEKLRSFVPGLTFNLGFCGAYYKRGTPAEVEGSHELVSMCGGRGESHDCECVWR